MLIGQFNHVSLCLHGGVPEWLNGALSKSVILEIVSEVRILPPPPPVASTVLIVVEATGDSISSHPVEAMGGLRPQEEKVCITYIY